MSSSIPASSEIESLRSWMESEALIVPEGWLEACLEWLSDQSDVLMTFQQLKEGVYQQWLHSDFNQLECPILPDQESVMKETLLLEGELCLQISALIKIGESYYGQIRRLEGNLGNDVPDLETDKELIDDVEATSIDPSFQLSNIATQSSFPSSNRSTCIQNANISTYALHLTDGVRTIKAIEVGSAYSATGPSPEEWFRIGSKVKLKGPLKLRKGVLLLPNGTISNPAVTAQLPNSQCCFLGGEVQFEETGERRMGAFLQRELLMKLNLSPDNPPEWFPGQRHLSASTTKATASNATDNIAGSTTGVAPQPPARPVEDKRREEGDLFDEDDLLLTSAVEDFESLVAAAVGDGTTAGQKEESEAGADVHEGAVDAALEEIDFSPRSDTGSATLQTSFPPKTSLERSYLPPSDSAIHQPQLSSSNARRSTQCLQSDIRRFLTTSPALQPQRQQHSPRMPQFAYLQDIYYDRQQRPGGGSEVHLIRGMLISIQSQLEHHEGQRWSLTVRLTDGTAVLDADMEDELLHRLIGLSALEVEAMKQMGRRNDQVSNFKKKSDC